MPVSYIYRKFVDAVLPTKVNFSGHLRRKDLPPQLVSKNIMFLRNKVRSQLKGTRVVKREVFDDNIGYHFDKYGASFRHLGVLILSVFKEFCYV